MGVPGWRLALLPLPGAAQGRDGLLRRGLVWFAVPCPVLQSSVEHHATSHCNALHYSVVHYIVMHCIQLITLQHIMVWSGKARQGKAR